MSLPTFPELPELTLDSALNMILTSIALEELALSHIMNAESEKLQYIIWKLCGENSAAPQTDELVAVNDSVARLLDSAAHNQLILKEKMETALEYVRRRGCPETKCCAVYTPASVVWRPCERLRWCVQMTHGRCLCQSGDETKIALPPAGRFLTSFSVNVTAHERCCDNWSCGDIAVSLQRTSGGRSADLFTVHAPAPRSGCTTTVSGSGIIVDTACGGGLQSLSLKLLSDDAFTVSHGMLTIAEQ